MDCGLHLAQDIFGISFLNFTLMLRSLAFYITNYIYNKAYDKYSHATTSARHIFTLMLRSLAFYITNYIYNRI